MEQKLYGGIEAGGSKFVCAVGTGPTNITEQVQIPTTSPSDTLGSVIAFFHEQPKLEAIGIASFGPLDTDKKSPTYGYITTTPKTDWAQTNLLGPIVDAFSIPVSLDTDVNGAALAEYRYGAGQGLQSVVYITVGTGIGVGCVIDDRVLSGGLGHTEMGHMHITLSPKDMESVSVCPYHESCLEGLASGPSLKLRGGVNAESIEDSVIWDVEAYYLAVGIVNIITTLMPTKIVVGGGVMNRIGLLDAVRVQVQQLLNGYVHVPEILENIEEYIVAPQLGSLSGIKGALTLASDSH